MSEPMTDERLREAGEFLDEVDGIPMADGWEERLREFTKELLAEVRRLPSCIEAAYREGHHDGCEAVRNREFGLDETDWLVSDARRALKIT